MDRSFDQVTASVGERPGQDAAYVIDSSRARAELGWSPQIAMPEGLAEVVTWLDDNWNEVRAHTFEYQHKE
jgi:dTDP-glucose 4,6-dehydratase